jgi:hypothetical protein
MKNCCLNEKQKKKKKKKRCVSIARAAFLQLKEIWTSRYLSTNTKIKLFNSNVKSMLHVLYGAETCEYHKEKSRYSSKAV